MEYLEDPKTVQAAEAVEAGSLAEAGERMVDIMRWIFPESEKALETEEYSNSEDDEEDEEDEGEDDEYDE